MTNGEKFKQIFSITQVDEGELYAFAWLPNHDAAEFSIDWWNANYSEIPTGSTDCISRQAVIDLMMQKWGENFSGDDAMQESIDAIREMPSVTPQEPMIVPIAEIKYDKDKLKELMNKAVLTVTPQEPRKGHWISTETKGVRYAFWCRYKCSLCGGLSDCTNFCPNCGARMVEPQESENP